MRQLVFLICVVIAFSLNAQQSEKEQVKQTVLDFFEAFHKQDTTALKALAKGNIALQSISTNKEGETKLSNNNFYSFVTSIGSIPKDSKFEERLLGFEIKIDGSMANAWTPYEFWYKGNFSHCGVNSFQFIKEDDKWKIIYLVDTRRRDGCKQ